jgi:hypothetical protein
MGGERIPNLRLHAVGGCRASERSTIPPKPHQRSPGTPTTSATHPTSMPHITSSRPTPLLPEASSSTSPSSCDTTRYAVRNRNGGPSLCQPSLTTRQRTPDNLAPSERALNPPTGWTCADAVQHTYDRGGAAIAHGSTTPPNHPFARTIWSGSCDAGQLTSGGLLDSSRHGQVRRCAPFPVCPTTAAHTLQTGSMGPLPRPSEIPHRGGPRGDMGPHLDGGPHDAGRRRHVGRHGPAHRGPALARAHPACLCMSSMSRVSAGTALPCYVPRFSGMLIWG